MLRIIKEGKAVSLKEQEKLVNAKGSIENVGPTFDPKAKKVDRKRIDKHIGLRTKEEISGGTKTERTAPKGK